MAYEAKYYHGLKNFSIIDFSELNLTIINLTVILLLAHSLKELKNLHRFCIIFIVMILLIILNMPKLK